MLTYAIIGSGKMGTALARHLTRAGIGCSIANTRGPDSLQSLVKELGETVVANSLEAALEADVVLLAIPFHTVEAFAKRRNDWSGKTIVDGTNAYDVTPEYLGGRLSSDIVAGAFRGASVVKAFNYLPSDIFALNPTANGGNRVMFAAGNHDEANAIVVALAKRLGFAPILLGRIDEGGRPLNVFGPLLLHNVVEFPAK
jgi:predicted dinucleotide-binding enzyme